MSQSYVSTGGWKTECQKPLFYNVWLIGDQKWNALFLIAALITVVFAVSHLTHSLISGFLCFCVLLPTVWCIFLPVHFEINSEGIVRAVLGRKRFIAWEDIRCYQIRRKGILLLPQNDRFFLESFRGYYLPIPSSLTTEVLYRFRVFVDRIED